ncbi:flagellin [Comamonas aquatica]|uniref:flagellin n=1 Tax=Comamonas aquatica TaxID=225991 RepID=UPI0005ED17ED|nr:flagellin [Comamonas aquatica]ANY60802.1 flagellin [Comamonas aquatica]
MAMTINTNVVSINAQRNLGLSGGSLSTSMQRLSSGLRVNSAKDDAAGLAIAERMSTQVRGFAVASRNANDGISLAQTAEGALGKVGDMLQRMRELAVQSGNATNSKSDREALNAELVQLRSEVDRVAKTTSFNGSKLLDGGFTGGVFQVGANAGDNITVGALADTRADKLGQASYATASTTVDAAAKDAARDAMTNASVTITVSGADGVGVTVQIAEDENVTSEEALGRFIEAVNSKTADTGVTAFLADDGKSIEYRATVGEGQTAASAQVAGIAGFAATGTAAGSVGIDKMDIKTQAGAWESLQRIDSAIDKVNSARAELGAIQTRFEKSIENIDIMQENISAARGRITDADFAKETANLSRTQILQQAGTAMVAQANQLPQNVLKLLQ